VTQLKWGFVLTWKIIIKYSDELFFGSDELIWDKTLNWVLFFDHNDIFYFGKNRIYDSDRHSDDIEELNKIVNDAIAKNGRINE